LVDCGSRTIARLADPGGKRGVGVCKGLRHDGAPVGGAASQPDAEIESPGVPDFLRQCFVRPGHHFRDGSARLGRTAF